MTLLKIEISIAFETFMVTYPLPTRPFFEGSGENFLNPIHRNWFKIWATWHKISPLANSVTSVLYMQSPEFRTVIHMYLTKSVQKSSNVNMRRRDQIILFESKASPRWVVFYEAHSYLHTTQN